MAREQDAVLQELTELGMAFARDLKAQVKLVKSVEDAGLLARAYERVVRGVRLTLALRVKLAREHLELDKLQRAADQKAADRRKAQIRAVLEPEIFTPEAGQRQADALRERLVERLDDDALFDQFLHAPFEVAVARIRKDIGLPETSSSSPVSTGEGGEERGFAEGKADAIDNDLSIAVTNARAEARAGPPKSGWWRGQAKPTTEPSAPPPRPLPAVVPLPRCEAEEEKKPAPS